MTLTEPNPSVNRGLSGRYLRPPAPLHFPEQETVPENQGHRLRVNALWESAARELGDAALVACDQFLYWDPTNPKKCLAPDLAVRVCTSNVHSSELRAWKTWELGAPHVGVEIVSDWDRSQGTLAQKLERYRQAGIAEVVRFDDEDSERPLRLWDLLDGDLVERDISAPDARFCDALGLYWCIVSDPVLGPCLRLARDPDGLTLLPTPAEERDTERAAKEAAVAAKEAAVAAKEAALARVAELEAELERRR
jgi:hypothetical protein